MTHIESNTEQDRCGVSGDPGDEVMRRIGSLDDAAEHFEDENLQREVDPEKVGSWITVIGRAILAIFKP